MPSRVASQIDAQDATGITGIDELVNKFIEAEEKNYSLFNYVNTLASDIEKVEKDVAAIKQEVDTYKGHGVHSDSQRKQYVAVLFCGDQTVVDNMSAL